MQKRAAERWLLGQALAKMERGSGPGRGKDGRGTPTFSGYLKTIGLKKTSAKKAQRGGDRKSEQYQSGTNSTLIADPGKARDKAAAAIGVSPRYVSDAKAIAKAAQLIPAVNFIHPPTLTRAPRLAQGEGAPVGCVQHPIGTCHPNAVWRAFE